MLYTVAMKNDKDFRRCYTKGKFVSDSAVTAYYLPNRLSTNRLGLTTSKKLGNAVVRNRSRRIMKAAYRLNEDKMPIGYDIVLVARSEIVGKKTQDIERFIQKRFLKLINDPNSNQKPKKNNKSKKA